MAETGGSPRRWLFAATILSGSFLLFLIQPMVARMALPRLGGAPNVWNSAMLVYQALLLGGYTYAHLLTRLPFGRQAAIHLALLLVAALTLPIALPEIALPSPGREAIWVPWLLLLTIGPLFLAVSAQAPLLQSWFAAHPHAGNPYPLYAASNFGSFAGLLAYPLFAEPLLPLGAQSGVWAMGYAVLILLVAATALTRRGPAAKRGSTSEAEPGRAPSARRILLWLALSAVPSGLMLSTTTHLTTDIFAMPLLWVIPLGLYLLSFSIAFSSRRGLAATLTLLAPLILCADGAIAMVAVESPGMMAAIASLILLFAVSVALHSRLYETRPAPAHLTQFYLVISAGGVLGGLFTALVAPLVFDWNWEHPILILAAAALVPLEAWAGLLRRIFPARRMHRAALALLLLVVLAGAFHLRRGTGFEPWSALDLLIFTLLVAAAILLATRRWAYVAATAALIATMGGIAQLEVTLEGMRSRSYFGIYTVRDTASGERQLLHGTTLHGLQLSRSGSTSTERTTYYGPRSGVGLALDSAERLFGSKARIGVVGLGVGTLACYRQPGQSWTFFEIDPEVLSLSRRGVFTFLERCAPEAQVVIGDARLELGKGPPDSFDILVVDAFSSDAIPLHLITKEAHDVYFRALAPDGLLLLHISNRFIDLRPVVAALAQDRGVAAAVRLDRPDDPMLSMSDWVVLSRDRGSLDPLIAQNRAAWEPLGPAADVVWRDDYASILPHLRWGQFL